MYLSFFEEPFDFNVYLHIYNFSFTSFLASFTYMMHKKHQGCHRDYGNGRDIAYATPCDVPTHFASIVI